MKSVESPMKAFLSRSKEHQQQRSITKVLSQQTPISSSKELQQQRSQISSKVVGQLMIRNIVPDDMVLHDPDVNAAQQCHSDPVSEPHCYPK